MENNAFRAGERVDYDLFFDWGIIWKKVGRATLETTEESYRSQPAYKVDLLALGNKTADLLMRLRDTLQCHVSPQMLPLHYKKAAEEGSHYSVDEAWYTYDSGMVSVSQTRTRPGTEPLHTAHTDSRCIYDMLSIIACARNFDLNRLAQEGEYQLPMATGRRVEEVSLVYLGQQTIKAKNGVRYRCKGFSILSCDEEKKGKEMLRFYVTDDGNRLPVRIDFNLKIGSAKAYLVQVSGNRHPLTSAVEH